MCKFMQSLSRSPEIIGAPQPNKNLEMFLKPCKDDSTFYRVRLLAFNSPDNHRTDPHITRIVHSSWVTDPNTGKKKLMKVVCPSKTPWVDVGDENKKNACKICTYVNQQWAIYNESGKSDKNASANARKYGSKYEAAVPVYVIDDPNYPKNNGKCKVIIFDDKEKYLAFRKAIEAQSRVNRVFNGEQAVDCLIYVGVDPIQLSNGGTFNKTTITKIKFSTKPKDIAAITSKLVDAFPFDETYGVSSTPEEIDEFYTKFCAIANDDIPEDDDIPVYRPIKNTPKAEVPTNENAQGAQNDIPEDDVDDLLGGTLTDDALNKDVASVAESSVEPAIDAKSDDDILKELGL